jgi:hypothetical protein
MSGSKMLWLRVLVGMAIWTLLVALAGLVGIL